MMLRLQSRVKTDGEEKRMFVSMLLYKLWELWPLNKQSWTGRVWGNIGPPRGTRLSHFFALAYGGTRCWENKKSNYVEEGRFQTAGASNWKIMEITRVGLTGMAFVLWEPQLLKLDMVCRIPSNTVTQTAKKEYLQTEAYWICGWLLAFQILCFTLQDDVKDLFFRRSFDRIEGCFQLDESRRIKVLQLQKNAKLLLFWCAQCERALPHNWSPTLGFANCLA